MDCLRHIKILSTNDVGTFHSGSRQLATSITRAQFSHRIVPGQAVKQFTSTSWLHFRKELKRLYIPEQYSVNDRRKDFIISHNESDQRHPWIELGSPDSQSNSLPIELTGRLLRPI
jgi:hypothetical protein